MQEYSTEVWKDVKGFEGCYKVSSLGRIKSIARRVTCKNGTPMTIKERIISQRNHPMGYLMVSLCKNAAYSHLLVHRVVAEAFLGQGPEGTEVCHNDANKKNNVSSNLRWGTREENCRDRLYHGVSKKLTMQEVIQIREMYATGRYSQDTIGKKFKVSQVMVSRIVKNLSWTF